MIWRVIWIIVWLIIVAYVVKRASLLGRSQLGWGIFAVILPVVALIIILIIGPAKRN